MPEYDNVFKRLDKLRHNFETLWKELNRVSGKNVQLRNAYNALHRDFEGLYNNPKVKKVIEEDKIDLDKYVKQFEEQYQATP